MTTLPARDAPPLQWALFYWRLGLIPLPCRTPGEAEGYADWKVRQYLERHPNAADEKLEEIRSKAVASAQKHPHGGLVSGWREGRYIRQPPTEAEIVQWFAGDDERAIFLLTGPGAKLSVIDVDTYKGGDPDPWIEQATVVVRSLRGGVHLYFAESDIKSDNDQLAAGVDRRGQGGGVVAFSGVATPTREIVRWALPLAAFPESARAGGRAAVAASTRSEMTPEGLKIRMPKNARPGTFAAAMVGPVTDNHRTAACKLIVGMLARREPLPEDAADAALSLLPRWLESTPAAIPVLGAAWAVALRAPRRDVEFAVTVVEAWAQVACDPAWEPSNGSTVAEVAASIWRSAEARETAAEAPPETSPETTPELVGDEDEHALQSCTITAYEAYTPADLEDDRRRTLLSLARLPEWLGRDGERDREAEYGHGWGEALDNAIGGGVGPEDIVLLTRRKAGGGKTAFIDQILEGIMLESARVWHAREPAPICPVLIVTEMPRKALERRGLARYLGVDQGIYRRGTRAMLAPGVRDEARRLSRPASAVAEDMFRRSDQELRREHSLRTWARRNLRRYVRPAGAAGPAFIEWLCRMAGAWRRTLARELGIDPLLIWPALLLDPWNRVVESDKVESEGAVAKALRDGVEEHKLIAFLTADTTKASVVGEMPAARGRGKPARPSAEARVAATSRGSYQIVHMVDIALELDVDPLTPEQRAEQRAAGREPSREARLSVGKGRFGEDTEEGFPLRWYPRSGRFVAVDPPPEPPPVIPQPSPPPDVPGGAPPVGAIRSKSQQLDAIERKRAAAAKARAAKSGRQESEQRDERVAEADAAGDSERLARRLRSES